jgi:hypothetical protein
MPRNGTPSGHHLHKHDGEGHEGETIHIALWVVIGAVAAGLVILYLVMWLRARRKRKQQVSDWVRSEGQCERELLMTSVIQPTCRSAVLYILPHHLWMCLHVAYMVAG